MYKLIFTLDSRALFLFTEEPLYGASRESRMLERSSESKIAKLDLVIYSLTVSGAFLKVVDKPRIGVYYDFYYIKIFFFY